MAPFFFAESFVWGTGDTVPRAVLSPESVFKESSSIWNQNLRKSP